MVFTAARDMQATSSLSVISPSLWLGNHKISSIVVMVGFFPSVKISGKSVLHKSSGGRVEKLQNSTCTWICCPCTGQLHWVWIVVQLCSIPTDWHCFLARVQRLARGTSQFSWVRCWTQVLGHVIFQFSYAAMNTKGTHVSCSGPVGDLESEAVTFAKPQTFNRMVSPGKVQHSNLLVCVAFRP